MMAGDMTPAMVQGEATANKRHAELMLSTDPGKIAAYDKQHGQGAYSHELKEKLYRTYGGQATQPSALQVKLSTNQPQPKISAPQPPTPPSNNVQVIKSGGSKGGGESQQSSNGSELPAINAGNGSKSKFTLLGISF